MKTNELDFYLPNELIAQQGLDQRSQSRLLVLPRLEGQIQHKKFFNIKQYLMPGDCLVLNQTKVIPARFYVQRATGGKIEGLFLEINPDGLWRTLLKGASRLKIGETIEIINTLADQQPPKPAQLKVIEKLDQGQWLLQNLSDQPHLQILAENGVTPLPPYIHRNYTSQSENHDRNRYQTIYAQSPGSVAAPTAGLHFTDELLSDLQANDIKIAKVTLHVGMGTFKPVSVDNLIDHEIHSEQYDVDQTNADIINSTIDSGGRIIAVGTTSVRTLESVAADGHIQPASGSTKLFIMPGYQYKVVDGIITNFHLPKSTLLALICAFSTKERVMDAYKIAVGEKYRFYSYGDSMLII
ncbi:MAG: tRNA preQ1(34) S-adenosylmethionine ribosyltransferase-isomerase QueA [Phycisphaerae bacterium]|nr:tRNA preQ1(34) S-adenosylmethionine ribosyltransferase-isomerase QueA [Phycisphaerae bacterium]